MGRVIDVSASGHYVGDCRALLGELEDGCIQTCVTSPPYWGLRDYGVEGQIGLEATPDLYVQTIVEVFREVWRVLADDGTLWLNLGDSYVTKPRGPGGGDKSTVSGTSDSERRRQRIGDKTIHLRESRSFRQCAQGDLKNKDLVGIPWMVAFALRADGWYLRSDIIWHKPNPMPESVTDRPTKSHEYLFLLSKSERYHYDADAIKEPCVYGDHPRNGMPDRADYQPGGQPVQRGIEKMRRSGNKERKRRDATTGGVQGTGKAYGVPWTDENGHRNKRSVWTVSTQPYGEAHFATFPPALIEPCILAGSKPGDVVLDPFFGSGTTGMVAEKHGRKWIGFDLNPDYAEMAKRRTAQRSFVLG